MYKIHYIFLLKRLSCIFLIFLFLLSEADARVMPRGGSTKRKGSAAAYGAFDATALSMMLWGTGMAIVITTAAILIPNSTSESNGHAH